jgi:hypothetical protein
MKKRFLNVTIICVAALVLLTVTVSFVRAQQGITEQNTYISGQDESEVQLDPSGGVENYIPVQGRLTDLSGNPLNGNYNLTFRLYLVESGGTALCLDTNLDVPVVNGLFNTEIWGDCQDDITGQQLYLGIEVEDDGEMSPRQPIYATPYAWSLRPGAVISSTEGNNAILHIENWASNGRGLRAYAMSETGVNYGIVGASRSPDGFGGYFYNNGAGVGLKVSSDEGTAISASSVNGIAISAEGVINSTEPTYLWVSGNDVRAYTSSDSTIIDLNSHGGAQIQRGATAGNKNVVLPITIAGTLYGQNVRLTALDLYWQGDTDMDAIGTIRLRRQTGTCPSCYENILADTTDYICWEGDNPQGCIIHDVLSSNNILTPDSGILYLTLELGFSGSNTWIDFGGVRLTLEYDD